MKHRQLAGMRRVRIDRDSTFLLTLKFLLGSTTTSKTKALLNVDKDALALQGYDPVAYFTEGESTHGDPVIESTYRGARYLFVSGENKTAFEQEPFRYEPQFGGYSAFDVSRGRLVSITVEAFQIVNGRLLLQFDQATRDKFNEDPLHNLISADEQWPRLVATEGESRRN